MDIGISSSCFYPAETEKALEKVAALGAKSAEIFFNCAEELEGPLLREMRQIQSENGIRVRSVHPYTSFAEPYMLFGGYRRRVKEGVDFYRRYFEAAAALGAECVVLHGGKLAQGEENAYFEAFGMLCEAAKPYGVIPAHEIVNRRSGANPYFLLRLRAAFPEDFRIVLDTKQCRRCGVDEYEFIRLFAGDIIQVHLSDCADRGDCLPPGEGEYDFSRLFTALKTAGYDKSAVIELYRSGFQRREQLKKSLNYLENIEKAVAINTQDMV